MTKNKRQIDFFGDGMRIFLDYIARQLKKNPDYKPHPIIRAFECAMQSIENCNVEDCTMGMSQFGTEKSVYEPYIVVLQKKNDGIEVKEIRNIKVDKQLPIDIMVIIFRLQIHLDKIEGDTVNPQQMVDALNAVIQGNKFYALGDRWKEARDFFQDEMKTGKVYLPKEFKTNGMIKEILSIKYDTPWEDYSNRLRSFIGTGFIKKLKDKNVRVVITSPINSKIEKYKVFEAATEFMIGESADYLKLFEKKKE